MTVAEAEAELATILAAISEYLQGKRRKRFVSVGAGGRIEQEFSDPAQLFDYLTKRRKELENFIAVNTGTATLTNTSFGLVRTVPMVFRK